MNANKVGDPAITQSNRNDAVHTAMQYQKFIAYTEV